MDSVVVDLTRKQLGQLVEGKSVTKPGNENNSKGRRVSVTVRNTKKKSGRK